MTTVHCPSCDGYQTAVMDDGQRSVGVCEGAEARTVETAEESTDQWLRDVIAKAKSRIGSAAFGAGPYGPTVHLVRSVYDILDDPRLRFVPPTPEEADPEDPHRYRSDGRDPYCATCHLPDIHGIHNLPEQPAIARECGNDSHHGYNTGYCGDCAKEATDAP